MKPSGVTVAVGIYTYTHLRGRYLPRFVGFEFRIECIESGLDPSRHNECSSLLIWDVPRHNLASS